jgi:hypothetical protein
MRDAPDAGAGQTMFWAEREFMGLVGKIIFQKN